MTGEEGDLFIIVKFLRAQGDPAMAKKAVSAKPSGGKPRHSNDERRRDGKGKGTGGLDNTRSSATVRRLEMYKTRPVRNSKGKILHEEYQSKALPNTRIQPDRRWFGE